jgi:phosphoglycolate phosphatase/pyrophosphatase PpaX
MRQPFVFEMKCVMFDFDGTLGNTLPMAIEAFRAAIRETTGRVLSDGEITAAFGPSEEGTIMKLVPDRAAEVIELYMKKYAELHPSMCPAPFGGIKDLIGDIKKSGVLCALVTGKGPRPLAISLGEFGLTNCFDAVETGRPDAPSKPECMRRVLKKFNLTPGEALYVGDASTDVEDAREIGCPVASAAWAETADPETLERVNGGMVFYSVAALRDYLTRVGLI